MDITLPSPIGWSDGYFRDPGPDHTPLDAIGERFLYSRLRLMRTIMLSKADNAEKTTQ